MQKIFLVLIMLFILVLNISIIYAADVSVWQGQYYTGTTFNTGTYQFNFTVYDALTGGNICYSNITNLTTGNWGEWKTEQSGVSSNCNNISKSYFLDISINGANQPPRRRLVIWDFFRKNVNETSTGKLQTSISVIAPIVQADTQVIAPIVNATRIITTDITIDNNASVFGVLRGHSPLRIGDSVQYVDANDSDLFSVYTARENVTGNNVSSQYYGAIIHQIETHTNPSGIEECWWDREDQEMRMCMDKTKIEMWNNLLVNRNINITGNATAGTGFFSYMGSLSNRVTKLWVQDIDASGNVNASNYTLNGTTIRDWSDISSGSSLTAGGYYLYNDSASIYLNGTRLNGTIDARATASNLTNYALKNQSETFAGNITTNQTGFFGWLGSLANRVTKLWVVNINATGNIETGENVSAKYIKGDGSLLTNLPAGSGLAPVYLGSNLTATSAAYTTIFTVALTPSKMNIVKAYLAQSSSTSGVAIQNRVIVSEAGPVGYCSFATQTQSATEVAGNIAVGTDSADTGITAMGLDTGVPFINTVTCAVLADANQKNLVIQFDSETVANVTTYAGSYYTNAVN